MALVWAEPPGWRARAAQAGGDGAATAARLQQAQNSLRALEDALHQLPRQSFDVRSIVDSVGAKPVALFEWVRDRTCWAPYRGLLRQDVGVLMDRTGNSLDRSFLLASLLKAAGQQVRLARAQLDERTAESLLTKMRPFPALPVPQADAPRRTATFSEAAQKYQLDYATVKSTMTGYLQQTAAMEQKLATQAAQQLGVVAAVVGKHPDASSREHAAALQAMQDHWWVQWQSEGKWLDLDPLLPDAKPGQTIIAAQQTIDPAALSDDLRQQVVVRVIVERWKDNKPQDSVVLEHAVQAAAVIGKEIHVTHIPMSWPGDFNPADPKDLPNRLKAAVLAQHEWVPVLVAGSETVIQSSFNDAGEINTKPNLSMAAKQSGNVTSSGQGVLDAFSGNDAPPAPTGALTAEWLEYETRVPGQPPQRQRRQIFDLIGPAARAAGTATQPKIDEKQRLDRNLALFGQTDILVCGCRISSAYLAGMTLESLLANRAMILALAGDDPALANPATARPLIEGIKAMPGDLEQFAYLRLKLGRYRNAQFIAKPNILTRHIRFHTGAAGQIMGCRAFDIVANEIELRPALNYDAFEVRLEQGVIDTDLESALLTGCGKIHSAAQTFAAAGADASQWTILKDARDPGLARLPVSDDAKARIAAALQSGQQVILPRQARTGQLVSWWRIDPASGTTLGIGENGWGPTMAEYATTALVAFVVTFIGCQLIFAAEAPNRPTAEVTKFCLTAAVIAAIVAVLCMFLLELAGPAGEGAGGGGAGGAGGGGGGPVDPTGPTLPGGPGGGGPPVGGGPPMPPVGGGPPMPPVGGGPPMPPVGGGGAPAGGGGYPRGFDPFGDTGQFPNTEWDLNNTISNEGAAGNATLSEATNTWNGIGGLGGILK